MLAIEARSVTYRRSGLTLIQHVSLCADRGEFRRAVLEAPGSGAETLLGLLAGGRARTRITVASSSTAGLRAARPTGIPRRSRGRWRAVPIRRGRSSPMRRTGRSSCSAEPPTVRAPRRPRRRRSVGRECRCPRRQQAGSAVVATLADPQLACPWHADTLAVLVAGRLVVRAEPGVALSPAVRALSQVAS